MVYDQLLREGRVRIGLIPRFHSADYSVLQAIAAPHTQTFPHSFSIVEKMRPQFFLPQLQKKSFEGRAGYKANNSSGWSPGNVAIST